MTRTTSRIGGVTILVIIAVVTIIVWHHKAKMGQPGAEAARSNVTHQPTQSEGVPNDSLDHEKKALDDRTLAPLRNASMTAMLNLRMGATVPDGDFELVYRGPLKKIKNLNPATIIMRQKTPLKLPSGKWSRLYGFADGSVLAAKEPDGNFERWETEYAAKHFKKDDGTQ